MAMESGLYSSNLSTPGVWRGLVVSDLDDGRVLIYIPSLSKGSCPFEYIVTASGATPTKQLTADAQKLVTSLKSTEFLNNLLLEFGFDIPTLPAHLKLAQECAWQVRTSLSTGDPVWVAMESGNSKYCVIMGQLGSTLPLGSVSGDATDSGTSQNPPDNVIPRGVSLFSYSESMMDNIFQHILNKLLPGDAWFKINKLNEAAAAAVLACIVVSNPSALTEASGKQAVDDLFEEFTSNNKLFDRLKRISNFFVGETTDDPDLEIPGASEEQNEAATAELLAEILNVLVNASNTAEGAQEAASALYTNYIAVTNKDVDSEGASSAGNLAYQIKAYLVEGHVTYPELQEKIAKFISTYGTGEHPNLTPDYTGCGAHQCTNLVKHYLKQVTSNLDSRGNGEFVATNLINDYSSKGLVTQVSRSNGTYTLQPGDIISYNPNHVVIVHSVNADSSYKIMHQNWGNGRDRYIIKVTDPINRTIVNVARIMA